MFETIRTTQGNGPWPPETIESVRVLMLALDWLRSPRAGLKREQYAVVFEAHRQLYHILITKDRRDPNELGAEDPNAIMEDWEQEQEARRRADLRKP